MADESDEAVRGASRKLVHVTYVTEGDKRPLTCLLELEPVGEYGVPSWEIVREVFLTSDGRVKWRRPTKKDEDFITWSPIHLAEDLASGALGRIDATTFEAAWQGDG